MIAGMGIGAVPVGLQDLPLLSSQAVHQRNQDLLHLADREYTLDGAPLRWARESDAGSQPSQADQLLWWSLEYAGHAVLVGTSASLVQSWMAPWGLRLDELNPQTLDLLAVTRLVPQLPAALRFRAVAFSLEGLGLQSTELVWHGRWQAWHAQTGERLPHRLEVMAPPDFAVYALWAALDGVLKPQRIKPRLSGLKMDWPVVAARWSVEAGELTDLEVGDVLLLR